MNQRSQPYEGPSGWPDPRRKNYPVSTLPTGPSTANEYAAEAGGSYTVTLSTWPHGTRPAVTLPAVVVAVAITYWMPRYRFVNPPWGMPRRGL